MIPESASVLSFSDGNPKLKLFLNVKITVGRET